jgi:hypothetical protein
LGRTYVFKMIRRFGLLLALPSLIGCEVWLDVENPQCKTTADCTALLGHNYTCGPGGVCLAPVTKDAGADPSKPPLPVRWACAYDDPTTFIEAPDQTVTIRMDAVDLDTLKVPPGIALNACLPTDSDCSAPILSGVQPGSDGFFALTLPYGFEGYFIFTAPGFVPGLSFTNKAYIQDVSTSGPAMVSLSSLNDIADHAGDPIMDGTGVAIVEMRDCGDNAGDGVSFDPTDDQTAFYFDGALPARGLSATTLSNLLGAGRESRAVAGFSNLPAPGYSTLQARLPNNNVVVGHLTVQILPNYITYVKMYAGS